MPSYCVACGNHVFLGAALSGSDRRLAGGYLGTRLPPSGAMRQGHPNRIRQMTTPLEFGLDTFGDVTKDALGAPLPHAQVIRNVIEEAVLADQLGIDFIGLGEHHRADFAISSPETVLAAIPARTERIPLGSAGAGAGPRRPHPRLPPF